jgi:hypothetical protein
MAVSRPVFDYEASERIMEDVRQDRATWRVVPNFPIPEERS